MRNIIRNLARVVTAFNFPSANGPTAAQLQASRPADKEVNTKPNSFPNGSFQHWSSGPSLSNSFPNDSFQYWSLGPSLSQFFLLRVSRLFQRRMRHLTNSRAEAEDPTVFEKPPKKRDRGPDRPRSEASGGAGSSGKSGVGGRAGRVGLGRHARSKSPPKSPPSSLPSSSVLSASAASAAATVSSSSSSAAAAAAKAKAPLRCHPRSAERAARGSAAVASGQRSEQARERPPELPWGIPEGQPLRAGDQVALRARWAGPNESRSVGRF